METNIKILDTVWMLTHETEGVVYCIGHSAQEVWQEVIGRQLMGTGITKETLRKRGWRAKQVNITLASLRKF